jgi:hypothetical protein
MWLKMETKCNHVKIFFISLNAASFIDKYNWCIAYELRSMCFLVDTSFENPSSMARKLTQVLLQDRLFLIRNVLNK